LYRDFNEKKPTQTMSDEHIHKAIVLHQGDSIPGFPSIDSFLYLISPLMKRLRDPALDLLSNVHIYLETIASQLIDRIFMRFPSIIDDINEIVGRVLKEERDIARELIESLIISEQTYIFTNDIEYIASRTSIIPTVDGKDGTRKIDPEQLFIDEMRNRIDAYFCIVLRNIRDSVPKIIGHFLVKAVQDNLQYSLYNEINKSEQLIGMVGEPSHITAERETLNRVLEVLQRAKRILTKDPDLAPQFVKETTPIKTQSPMKSTELKKPDQMYGGPTQNPSQPEKKPLPTNTNPINPNPSNPNPSIPGNQTRTTTGNTKSLFG
jgi:hypothetical protein